MASLSRRFCGVEKELWDNLAVYKEITIREHVYHLLKDLSNEIKETIDTHIQKLQNSLSILKNNNIKRIEELTDDLYNGACFAIDRFYSAVPLSADSYRSSAKDSCRSIIRGAGRLRNYKENEAPRINRIVTDKANQYMSLVKGRTSQSADIVAREVSIFRTEFHSHYKDMPSLEPNIDYTPSMTSINSMSIDLSNSNSLNNGTFLGRLITNVWNFFRSEQAIQDEVILEINDAIDRHFLSIESSVRNSVEIIKEKQKKSLRNYCNKHIKQYRRRVEKLIKKQTLEKTRIESCINENKKYINKISNLQESLQKEISLLLTT